MDILGKQQLVYPKFYCKKCHYGTSKKSSFDNHNMSLKHKNSIMETPYMPELCSYVCNCGKQFKTNSGLWKHHKLCNFKLNNEQNAQTDKELIMLLIKENSEFKTMMLEQNKQMMEIAKNAGHNTTNSHNKAFNLNFFLNETCKDAMNITEFVNSIQLQLSDLERMGEVGYVEGLSSIISRNLKALDVNMRPVHCTDKKREIMYIKDETKWEKDEENVKMHKMVRNVAFENQRQILKYKEIHPDCGKSTSKYSDPYNKILVECMGGPGDNDFEKEEKIISKISKCVLVEKEP
jgi:hypothetical protein